MKTFLLILLAALAAAPAALADGVPQYAAQGGIGVLAPDGTHYVALGPTRARTTLVFVGSDGRLWTGPTLRGSWGTPMVTQRDVGGLSRDGRLFFLQSTTIGSPTSFLVLDTHGFRVRDRFRLHGTFSFDALSPDGSRLYVIQRIDASNLSRYVVRAYDLRTHRLLPARISDPTQRTWVMQGDPWTRVSDSTGRWVYTLYSNPGGYPFVHALDTVRGVAHCIGIPWSSTDQTPLFNVVLHLRNGSLDLDWRSGRPYLRIDTATWRVSQPPGSSFPWPWLALVLLPAAAAVGWRRRPRGTLRPREA
jgi:hypothetical protein